MDSNKPKVVTRIAPSPTGLFHIGTARTALFNYLFAQKHNGTFLVRIEDTDKARSESVYEKDILDGFRWLGLEHSEPVRQSERMALYAEKLDQLISQDHAYVSREPAKDDASREVEVVRLRNPGKKVQFQDEIRGDIMFDTTELGDFVIARSRTDPLYHLAVVVDDADMGVTHVIRGEDGISNTPRQILIQEALGFTRPAYGHLPLILAPDKSKLSKRKGAVSVSAYREEGFLPEAIVNYLALLGWNPGTDQEVFTLSELIEQFSLEGVQKGGAIFDIEKLKWVNREHRARMPREKLVADTVAQISESPEIMAVVERCSRALDDMLERFSTHKELKDAIGEGEFSFYEARPTVEKEKLTWKKDPNPERLEERLREVLTRVEAIDTATFTYDVLKDALWDFATEEGRGNVLWPLRYALSGKDRSPDPFLLLEALGREESLVRLNAAIDIVT